MNEKSDLKLTDNIASMSKLITDSDVRMFAQLSMDENPLHLDEDFAKTTIFGQRIAHGAYVSSFISAVIANILPGRGTIYLAQNTSFKKPVFIGDTVTARVELIHSPKPGILILKTTCLNQNQEVVIEGDATVLNKEYRG
jgi:3-hydroxybutyryl-CoA dehydratase